MKVWEASSAQGVQFIPDSATPGYECSGFAEIAETVMYSPAHESNVAILFHTATDVVTTDGKRFDAVWIVGIEQATEDSYNMEQFEYARAPALYQAMFDDYHEAKSAWLEMLGNFVMERGV
jgi:hypothetical protein